MMMEKSKIAFDNGFEGVLSVRDTLNKLKILNEPWSDTPALDAQVLVAHITDRSRTWLLAHPETILTIHQQEKLHAATQRLILGEPLPYILGHWEFFALDFQISPATLIPRPETELIVQEALEWLSTHPDHRNCADVGTGSGCIAISLAVNVPDLDLVASDISHEALEIAQHNAAKHECADQIRFIRADLLDYDPSPGIFNLIIANLPYIPTPTLVDLGVYAKEPTLALDGGKDGLAVIGRFLPQAVRALAKGGLLLLEIEASQGNAAYALARKYAPDSEITVLADLAGRDRAVRIEKRQTSASN
jgi:release factor glutamine methyltransferase